MIPTNHKLGRQSEVVMFTKKAPTDKSLCFVLMPFALELEPMYQKILEVTVIEQQLSCVRADSIYSAEIIIDEIWEKICQAQIIIADATGKNANVFYEMGLAHALGKDVIILAQSMDDIPFDLRHRRILIYSLNRLEEFAIKLSRIIETVKSKPIQICEWLTTDVKDVRVGLCSPTDKYKVHETPIDVSGRVIGLPSGDLSYSIQGFVITDEEYQQDTCVIAKDGSWRLKAVHLGATEHKLFFRIFDESGRLIAESMTIKVFKEDIG